MQDGRVVGVVTDRGEVQARDVVDSTGGIGWLARKLGWEEERRNPRLIASYGYVETEDAAEWFLPELQATAGRRSCREWWRGRGFHSAAGATGHLFGWPGCQMRGA